MEPNNQRDIRHQVNDILAEPSAPMDKVQRIVSLGYDEQEADMLVEKYQSGQSQPVFYEELPRADYAKSEGDVL